MTRITLLLIGAPLLLLAFFGGPLIWPLDGALPNLVLRVLLWVAASSGALCLWVALSAPDEPCRLRGASRPLPRVTPHAA